MLAVVLCGCQGDSGATSEDATQTTQNDRDNARLATSVQLAKVHLKHDEFEEAEKVLIDALSSSKATETAAAS